MANFFNRKDKHVKTEVGVSKSDIFGRLKTEEGHQAFNQLSQLGDEFAVIEKAKTMSLAVHRAFIQPNPNEPNFRNIGGSGKNLDEAIIDAMDKVKEASKKEDTQIVTDPQFPNVKHHLYSEENKRFFSIDPS